jgi:hypothetical protein
LQRGYIANITADPDQQNLLIGGFGFAYPLDVLAQHLQDWGIRF